jgi:hypothetical protein
MWPVIAAEYAAPGKEATRLIASQSGQADHPIGAALKAAVGDGSNLDDAGVGAVRL